MVKKIETLIYLKKYNGVGTLRFQMMLIVLFMILVSNPNVIHGQQLKINTALTKLRECDDRRCKSIFMLKKRTLKKSMQT